MDGVVFKIVEFLHVKPGKGSAFVRTKLKNLISGGTVDRTFRAGEYVKDALVEKAEVQFTYMDGDNYVFLDMTTFNEERVPTEKLGDAAKYISAGLNVQVVKWNGTVIDVEIPSTLVLEVVETDPGVKGNTSQGGNKPAKLESGAVVQVPLFIAVGEKIRVDTRSNSYLSRA